MTRTYNLRHPWIPIILLLLSIMLLISSIPQMKLNIGLLGLIHSFPLTYFLSLTLLSVSFIIALKSNKTLLPLQLLTLITTLWLIPTVVGSHPGTSMAYRALQHSELISSQGIGNISSWYLSWPGLQVLLSLIKINLEPLITTFPYFIQLLYFFPLFIFLRNILGEDRRHYCWVGVWLFYLGNWLGQDYLGPQALAFLLLLIILAMVTHRSLWEGPLHIRTTMTLVIIVVFCGLIVTHLLTSLAVICLLGAYTLVRKSPRLALATTVCILLLVGWDASFGAHYSFRLAGGDYGFRFLEHRDTPIVTKTNPVSPESPGKVEKTGGYTEVPGIIVLDPEYILESNVLASISGSESHTTVVKVRIAYSLVYAIIGILGGLLILLYRRTQNNIAILALGLSLFLLLPLRHAGWELTQRLYMFELPIVAYLGIVIWETKKLSLTIALGALIIIGSLPLLICHYGNQSVDYWSQDYRDGYKYVQELQEDTTYKMGSLKQISWVEGNVVFSPGFPTTPYYLPISQYDDNYFTFLYNNPDFIDNVWEWLQNSPTHISVYKNPEFEVFRKD